MRLSAAASALLALRGVSTIPTFGGDGSDNTGLILERASAACDFEHPELQQRASRFLNEASAPFAVNGSGLPNITWDVGESYAGLLPISSDPGETRKLFFWFFPSYNPEPKNEIVVWLNGGPGCSSMEGLLTENGPINWLPGMDSPTPNLFTWLNLTSVVWVDQPVGVGYTEGSPNIETEEDLAAEFIGFWKNFVKTFCLEDWRTYLAGQSYAGVYIPYIAGAFIGAGDTTYYNLVGVHMNAAVIGDTNLQMNIPVSAYASHWNPILGLNESFVSDLHSRARECGLTRYMDDHLLFPPPMQLFRELVWQNITWAEQKCNMLVDVMVAARLVNPCLNIYHITDACPKLPSILGPENALLPDFPGQTSWFSHPSVRAALNVPTQGTWSRCITSVFRNRTDGKLTPGDPYSDPPASTNLLGRIIEYTSNVIIGSGGLDMLVPTNGTLLVLQNVTWGGVQGFQEKPARPFFSPYYPSLDSSNSTMAGVVGTWGRERGLTFYEVELAGHELPRYAPGPSFRAMEMLLGRVSSLTDTNEFTTLSAATHRASRNNPAV